MADKLYSGKDRPRSPKTLRVTPEVPLQAGWLRDDLAKAADRTTPKATTQCSPKARAPSAPPRPATSPTRMDTLIALHVDIGVQAIRLKALRDELDKQMTEMWLWDLDTAKGQLGILSSSVSEMQATLGKLSTNGG